MSVNNYIHKIVEHLLNNLFSPEENNLKKRLDNIFIQNKEAYGPDHPHDQFTYMGKAWPDGIYPTKTHRIRKVLHISLNETMNKFLRDETKLKNDKQKIKQILFILVESAYSSEQLRNTLPECLVKHLPNLSVYNRTDEEGCSLRDNSRGMKQYLKLKDTIDFYSVMGMMH